MANGKDYGRVEEELLLIDLPDEPRWLAKIGRSINELHHRVAALHRKVDHMSPVDLGPLEEAVANLQTNDATLTSAVQGASDELGVLAAHATALEEQIAKDETVDPAKVAAILTSVGTVGSHLTALSTQISTATTAAEGSPAGEGTKPAAALPLYNFTGDPATIDASVWSKAPVQGTGGVALYTFAHDTAGQPPTGEGNGWTVWTGATEPVPAA